MTPCGPYEIQGSPWDWWDNDLYGAIADQYQGTDPGTMGCLALLDSPDMSEEKGMAYADLIQQFMAPRVHAALGLESVSSDIVSVFSEATSNQDINQYVSMGLTLSATDLAALDECSDGFTMFAPSSALDDAALAEIVENADTPLLDILAHHVHAGASLNAADLSNGMVLEMMDGNSVAVTIDENGVMIDDAMVTTADIVCSNGVIHIIDGLLFSQNFNIDEVGLNYSVFPNPSKGEITINNYSNESYNVKIFNTIGEIILTETLSEKKSFDLTKFGKGIYLIEMSNANSIKTQKVIIE